MRRSFLYAFPLLLSGIICCAHREVTLVPPDATSAIAEAPAPSAPARQDPVYATAAELIPRGEKPRFAWEGFAFYRFKLADESYSREIVVTPNGDAYVIKAVLPKLPTNREPQRINCSTNVIGCTFVAFAKGGSHHFILTNDQVWRYDSATGFTAALKLPPEFKFHHPINLSADIFIVLGQGDGRQIVTGLLLYQDGRWIGRTVVPEKPGKPKSNPLAGSALKVVPDTETDGRFIVHFTDDRKVPVILGPDFGAMTVAKH